MMSHRPISGTEPQRTDLHAPADRVQDLKNQVLLHNRNKMIATDGEHTFCLLEHVFTRPMPIIHAAVLSYLLARVYAGVHNHLCIHGWGVASIPDRQSRHFLELLDK